MATQTITTTPVELDQLAPCEELSDLESRNSQPTPAGRVLADSTKFTNPPSAGTIDEVAAAEPPKLSRRMAWVTIIQLCGNNFISTFSAGLLLISIPTIAADLELPRNLLIWPTAVTPLASASCQLIVGSIADVVGLRRPNTFGSFVQSLSIIAVGLSKDGTQLIAVRALQGVATSIFSTSGRAILSSNIERGRLRNFAFAAMILCYPVGAGFGLVLGGIYADKASWRIGFYSSGALGLLLSLSGLFTLPPDIRKHKSFKEIRQRLAGEIDWVGAMLASSSLTILSYVLSNLSASTQSIHEATNIALLALSLALVPAFAFWMRRQESRQKPALIPNALWKNKGFTSIVLIITLINAAQQSLAFFVNLFFQEVQSLSPLQSSIRLIPQAVTSTLMCLAVGLFVNKITPYYAIVSTMALSSISPLLMAITNPAWPYWYTAFWAQVIGPVCIDVVFVVGALVMADAFSGKHQARASAVFSTFSQLGGSMLSLMSVVSDSVGGESHNLLKGYRASFWTQFAWILASVAICLVGLRKLGRVGMKKD